MDIYYLKISDLLNKYSKEELLSYSDTDNISSEERFIQHCAGRFLVKNVCTKIYNINAPKIVNINKKPKLENNEINFSLTHSKNYVVCVFDKYPCGIDLEYMRPVNLEAMSKRYNKNFKSQEDFYEFWTNYEASIKLGAAGEFKYVSVFQNEYYLTVLSSCQKPSVPVITDFLKIY